MVCMHGHVFFHFILPCVCVRARACVCMLELVCVSRHARGCSHISLSPGDDAKNMWLLKPSGVWAASVCSPLLSLWPSLPSVTPVSSIPPSITPSSKHSTLASARTHTHQLHPAVSLLHFHRGWPLLSQRGIKRGEWKGGEKVENGEGKCRQCLCRGNDQRLVSCFFSWAESGTVIMVLTNFH